MDQKPYKAVNDLYKFFKEKKGELDAVDVAYITGVLKTLTDLYYEPEPEMERRQFKVSDIFRGQP